MQLPERETLDKLVSHGASAADLKVLMANDQPPAQRVRIAVRCALEALIAQGFLTVTDPAEWPAYFYPDGIPTSGPFAPKGP